MDKKTAIYYCRPHQAGKLIEQFKIMASQNIAKIVVEESHLKEQRDELLKVSKDLLKLVSWYLEREKYDHSAPCDCSSCKLIKKSKAAIVKADS